MNLETTPEEITPEEAVNRAAELADVYVRPDLPQGCSREMGSCAVRGCPGLVEAAVVDRMLWQATNYTGSYCPSMQVSTPDGKIHNRSKPVDWAAQT